MQKPESLALVIPPSIFLLDERVFPSLGILKIAAVLESEGISVDMIDLSGIENYLEALEAYLKETTAKHIGLTTTTPQMPSTTKIIKKIRRVRPDMKIILGGPHVTLVSSATKLIEKTSPHIERHRIFEAFQKLQNLVDVLVSGDGELAILESIKDDAPSFVDGDDPKKGLFMSNGVYEQSPFPSRHLIDLSSYHYSIEGHPSTSLIAQLGCPFQCGFCGGRNSKSLRVVRTRSVESIIDEVKFLHQTYGHTGFMFYDDELNVNKNMIGLMNAMADLQADLGVSFRLRGFVKAELFTLEQAEAMYRAGFRWLLTGFESGSPRILTNINKKATREENTRAVEFARRAGLKVKALMSVGHPGESEETISETHDWLLEVKPDDFDCTIITTYPGTPYYDQAIPHQTMKNTYTYTYEKTGDQLHSLDLDFTEVEDYYKGDPEGGYRAYVFTDFLSSEKLVEMRNWVEASVRNQLKIPFNPKSEAIQFEHSMGLSGDNLPHFILRRSEVLSQ